MSATITLPTIACRKCGQRICDCMLSDPLWLAQQVGKVMSTLSGGKAKTPAAFEREIKRRNLGPDYYCFAAPDWVRRRIIERWGVPDLDVASSYGMHFGEKFYTPEQDGLRQDWSTDSHHGFVFCHPPFDADRLETWVSKCLFESQRGCEVLAMLPLWRKYSWLRNIVFRNAWIYYPEHEVVCQGFGPMKGKKCGNTNWYNEYETIFALFDPKRKKGSGRGWL